MTRDCTSDAELDAFVRWFRERTLPKWEWTHAAHLAVGTWHVHRYGVRASVDLLRDGICTLNQSHGTANTDSGGYHETITRAYGMARSRPETVAMRRAAGLQLPGTDPNGGPG